MEKLKEIFIKYREQISYLFFGGLTFVVGVGTFWLFNSVMKMPETAANIPSNIIAILFAYVVNKLFVFEKKTSSNGELLKEFISFLGGRAVTFVLEEIIIYLGVKVFHIEGLYVKLIGQVVVIVSNYFISKFIVFRKN